MKADTTRRPLLPALASALRMKCTRKRCQVAQSTRVMAALRPSWAGPPARRNPPARPSPGRAGPAGRAPGHEGPRAGPCRLRPPARPGSARSGPASSRPHPPQPARGRPGPTAQARGRSDARSWRSSSCRDRCGRPAPQGAAAGGSDPRTGRPGGGEGCAGAGATTPSGPRSHPPRPRIGLQAAAGRTVDMQREVGKHVSHQQAG